MKKIGFIDRHLNNFHSNLYVDLIRNGKYKNEFDVTLAYGDEICDGIDTKAWCDKHNVVMAKSIEQVVNECDHVIILSPDNPERHWDLSEYALKSGKACYIDKTFAPDYKTAKKLISLAKENKTPMFTTSSLRFVPELINFINTIGKERKINAVATRGPGHVSNYMIHSVEPLVMLIGYGASSISYSGNDDFSDFDVKYDDGRIGSFNMYPKQSTINDKWYGHPFEASVAFEGGATSLRFNDADMFKDLLDAICAFFLGEKASAPFEDTLEVMAILEAAGKAYANPGKCIDIKAIRS